MAKTYRKEDFEFIMSKVAKVDKRVKEYLEDVGYEKWSRCHSPNCKNNEIASYTNTTLGRRFEEILILNRVKALRMMVKPAGSYLYCVYDSGWRYIVDIERGTCNCGRYQIDEIPCPHRIVILKSITLDVKEYGRYCSELYRPNTIVKTYELPIVSMPDKKDSNVPFFVDDEEVLPSKYRRPPGRPKKEGI
ncbi:uncharacterized protein LOC124887867 [Capsicum annuum]|uniref:uncharacterized protein LOC124887867 n=1 Tax=Capsicum annuum TaxID=4072 RepID=UPI001FB118FA|nr:uncharacterized protein LOC124887867 [Capsicum annuum]